MTREKGVTHLDDANPKNAKGVEPKCSGPSLHEHTGSEKNSMVRAAAGGWEVSFFRHRDAPQRSVHKKKKRDTRLLMYTALYHIPSSADTYTRATARRDSFIHSFIHSCAPVL